MRKIDIDPAFLPSDKVDSLLLGGTSHLWLDIKVLNFQYINKGDLLFQATYWDRIFHEKEIYPYYSPECGYFYLDCFPSFWNIRDCKTITVRFYDTIEDLLQTEFGHNFSVFTDAFTNTKTIDNKHLFEIRMDNMTEDEGPEHNLIIDFEFLKDKPVIRISYNIIDYKVKVGDKVILLFNDGSTIQYLIHTKPKYLSKAGSGNSIFYSNIPLSASEINALSDKFLDKVRLIIDDSERKITFKHCLNNDCENDQKILLNFYAKAFSKALIEYGVDINHLVRDSDEIGKSEQNCNRNKEYPCYVYLMQDTANGFYKIGISNNPEYREGTLQSEKPTIELICARQYPTRTIAEAFEAALHNTFADKRLRGEWFELSPQDVEILKGTLKD